MRNSDRNMKCDLCGADNATVHVQQIKGSEGVELHLCDTCAASKGITTGEDRVDFSISSLLTGLVDVKALAETSTSRKSCPRCGLTLAKFKKIGKLGCNECYMVFASEVRKVVGKMFGRTRHTGKYPKRLMAYKAFLIDLERLKKMLEKAVKAENYEEAAKLRDQIKDLERLTPERENKPGDEPPATAPAGGPSEGQPC